MGIRVHKIVGYGLTDVQTDSDGNVTDPRINSARINPTSDTGYEEYEAKLEGFVEWFAEDVDRAAYIVHTACGFDSIRDTKLRLSLANGFINRRDKKKDYAIARRLIEYQTEYGESNVLLFTPVEEPNWYRNDDIIDYVEECLDAGFEVAENRVVNLWTESNSCGIYPYNLIVPNPFREKLIKEERLPPAQYNMAVGRWNEDDTPHEMKPEILKHLQEDWQPLIPYSILAFCLYMGVFTHPKYLFDMRPIFYTYWG